MNEEEILENGFEKVGENLYTKKGNLFVQQKGEMKLASFLDDEELRDITDFEAYKKLSEKEEKEKTSETSEKEKTSETSEKKESEAVIPVEKLKEIDFEERKTRLWSKDLGDGLTGYWDYRDPEKYKNGRFFVTTPDDKNRFLSDAEAKKLKEYTYIRQGVKSEEKVVKKPLKGKLSVGKPPSEEKAITLRGTEDDIISLMNSIRLDSIIEASTDKLGEGVLYHNLGPKIGLEPSAELVDMITSDMGDIETELVEIGMHRIIDEDEGGDSYLTYYAVVKATDKTTGTTGLGAAEEIIDFKEMQNKNNPRTFARTKVIRKAERNAKERCIPVPRKALVILIKKMLREHKDKIK